MKISDLIKDIVILAEEKFNIDQYHENDSISVGIFFDPDNMWQTWIQRPTKRSLNRNTISLEELIESKTEFNSEIDSFCFVREDSLIKALNSLYKLLDEADMIPDNSPVHLVPDYT